MAARAGTVNGLLATTRMPVPRAAKISARCLVAAGRKILKSSLQLHAAGLDHLRPFLRLVGDQLAEIGGRARQNNAAKLGEPRLHARVRKGRLHFLVELVDD